MEVVDNANTLNHNGAEEVKAFDETKAGVKGIVDSGVAKIPSFFINPSMNTQKSPLQTSNTHLQIPVIDFNGCDSDRRKEIVNDIRYAAETWGFFQMVNHGIPIAIMDELLKQVKAFHEQPTEAKMEWYSRELTKPVKFHSNPYIHGPDPADWRDTLQCEFFDEQLNVEALPQVCREAIGDYMKCMIELKGTVAELLSEALGLSSDYLTHFGYMKSESMVCHYYPACPEPDLTLGINKHSDPTYITILLQDSTGGLQALHQDQWVDVPHVHGALIANIGDLMQLISNDKFKSLEHRVLAKKVGPRLSAACFFFPSTSNMNEPYGPLKELLSDNNQPIYKETSFRKYVAYYKSKGNNGASALPHFKL